MSAPSGSGRPGEDPGALARADGPRGKAPAGIVLHHAEPHGPLRRRAANVVGAGGVAVHGGVGPGGDVERADDVLGEHAVERVVERDAEGGLAADLGQDAARGLRRGAAGVGSAVMRRAAGVLQREGGEQLEPHRVLEADHRQAASKSRSSVTIATQRAASGEAGVVDAAVADTDAAEHFDLGDGRVA